jgi:hypothetical protein
MQEIIEVIRRHEKTIKGPDGKKLDQPTPEGFAYAYQQGVEFRAAHPNHRIKGYCSDNYRTYASCVAHLAGAGVRIAGNLRKDHRLNNIKMSHEVRDKIRGMPNKEKQCALLYSDFAEEIREAGHECARNIVLRLEFKHDRETRKKPLAFISVTHGPVIDAAYLVLIGKDITVDNLMEETGIIDEGYGFDIKFREEDGLYLAELTLGQKTQQYELAELVERAEKPK